MIVKRTRTLRTSKDNLFDFLWKEATPEQWANWLRVSLELAASRGDVELVNALLAAGADSCNPLHLTVEGGHEQVVRALLDNGACRACPNCTAAYPYRC